jgi:hypothetical protein
MGWRRLLDAAPRPASRGISGVLIPVERATPKVRVEDANAGTYVKTRG